MAKAPTMADAVSAFGALTKAKLSSVAASGAAEDQLRAPLESLVRDLAAIAGIPGSHISLVGESTLAHLNTRPDYAVTVHNSLVGYIEVKAPGKGADPRRFKDAHDAAQWGKLKSLPNILYTDGNEFALWRDGGLVGQIVRLDGTVGTSGAALSAPPSLQALIDDFLHWQPVPPATAKQLAIVSARLCRLLRDEVLEQVEGGSTSLLGLAADWRRLLFPDATNAQFADGYAQAVTFGLLVARARDIPLAGGIDRAALELRNTSSLIGAALRILTDDPATRHALKTSLDTLARVLDVVDWSALSKGSADAWLYFYEDFLAVYDNALRKRTGSYYTPPEVVETMVRLVDECLRRPDMFGRPTGLASPDVTIADPAVGTGTFLLGVFRRIAASVEEDEGAGAVPAAIAASVQRLIGFELQFGPFAVAQLRIIAELHALLGTGAATPEPRLFITDTLGNPFVEEEELPQILQPVAQSRRRANEIKRNEPITVVIGNPPYKEKAKGRGGWVEAGTAGRESPMDRWLPPASWGVGAHAKHLKNLYVYFWRWATWKVFGTGLNASTGFAEAERAGIVCFITVAGFLNGPGFERMRDDLRRSCDRIWVIDCSPEGHQPEVATRIFQGVQHPVCIVLAARRTGKKSDTPATVRFRALAAGRREAKFETLAKLTLDGAGWTDCPGEWRAPFLPTAVGAWGTFPALDDLFVYNGSGVMPGRTWIIAPDVHSLERRWAALIREKDPKKQDALFYPHQNGDKTATKRAKSGLTGHEFRSEAVSADKNPAILATRYGFRSFDRQWIVPDTRLINRPNPTLWDGYSDHQIFLTAPEDRTPINGPAVTFCGIVPDLHHYNGRGGRVYPLWAMSGTGMPNVKAALLTLLSAKYGPDITAPDVIAYIAALLAHSAFTLRFAQDLLQPGLHVPLTADRGLFAEATTLGREIVWLQSFGERFADPAAGRPSAPPRLPRQDAPRVPAGGAIPGAPEPLPDEIGYDAGKRRLRIGKGYIDNVAPAIWAYEVSGKQVLRQWFSYRRRDRTRPVIGDRRPPSPLDSIQVEHWPAEYTTELLNVLHVLGRLVALEPKQADLLDRICAGPTIGVDELRASGALAAPGQRRTAGKVSESSGQVQFDLG